MAVKLRFTRMGRRHRPFFRINAVDSRTPRNGKILEKLGHYDPIEKDKDKQVVLDLERGQRLDTFSGSATPQTDGPPPGEPPRDVPAAVGPIVTDQQGARSPPAPTGTIITDPAGEGRTP